jgi:hypothetical protein
MHACVRVSMCVCHLCTLCTFYVCMYVCECMNACVRACVYVCMPFVHIMYGPCVCVTQSLTIVLFNLAIHSLFVHT